METRTVVLLGDVGMGKSTLVEKVTGIGGISSDADESFTKASQIFQTSCGRLQLIDTPGANAMQDKLLHNAWIAHAMNYAPVSLMLIVVKADTRIDNTLHMVRNYAERFMDMFVIMGVCVTHMDSVTWDCPRFLSCMQDELGFDTAVFSGNNIPGESVLMNILQHCRAPMDLRIDSDNFLKYFRINNSNLKILKSVSEEVARFRLIKKYFDEDFTSNWKGSQWQIDLVFEFQAWMLAQITYAQQRVAEDNSFSFSGDAATVANQAGHIASLTNQLRAVLFEIRTMTLAHQKDAGSDMRKCPHCGEVWVLADGCTGGTTCGQRVDSGEGSDTLATFCFSFDGVSLIITRASSKQLMQRQTRSRVGYGKGCGASINWMQMAPVQLPPEFRVTPTASTDDVELIPQGAKRTFQQAFSNIQDSLGPLKRTRIETPSFR